MERPNGKAGADGGRTGRTEGPDGRNRADGRMDADA